MARHTGDSVCPSCEEKLATAHSKLGDFFRLAKAKYPDLHVSWAYRDQASQDQAFTDGKSKLKFPDSAHNKTPSLAIDLFQIDEQGLAVFDGVRMAKVCEEFGQGIKWGGQWRSLGDSDHFELIL